MSADSVPSSKTNIFQNKLIYCHHFRTYSRCAMFDWSDTVFRRRNVTCRRISNTVLQPRYWGREADSPRVLPIEGSSLFYCHHFRTYSRCAMFDWSDTVFRRRNVTCRRISNTVLHPRYWGREADSPEVCRLRVPVYSGFQFFFRVPVYSGFQFIQNFILFRVPVKSGFLFILVVSYLFRVPVYSGFQFIQHFSLIRVPVKSGFLFILVFSLFRVPVYSGFQFIQSSN